MSESCLIFYVVDPRQQNAGEGSKTGDDEIGTVAQGGLQESGNHAWQGEAQTHDSGEEGVVGCLVLAFGTLEDIDGVGGKSETVAKLFEAYAASDDPETGGGRKGQPDVEKVWQIDGQRHGDEAAAESETRDGHASEYASNDEGYDAPSAIEEAVLLVVECQASVDGFVLEE